MVSVVVPIYNVEKYLCECLESVINQTYDRLEIILVDDGSEDNCGRICDEYASRDHRIKVIHKLNGGLSDARNAGLEIAQGEYVYFLDSDDYIQLDAIDHLVDHIEKEQADFVFFNTEVFSDEEGVPVEELRIKHLYKTMPGAEVLKLRIKSKEWLPGVPLHFYRASFLRKEQLSFKKGILYEDVPFSGIAYARAQRVSMLKDAFYRYRMRKGSTTKGITSSKNMESFLSCIGELAKEKTRYEGVTPEVEAIDLLIKHTAEEYAYWFNRLSRQERRKADNSRRGVIMQLSSVHTVSCRRIKTKLRFPNTWYCIKKAKGKIKHLWKK